MVAMYYEFHSTEHFEDTGNVIRLNWYNMQTELVVWHTRAPFCLKCSLYFCLFQSLLIATYKGLMKTKYCFIFCFIYKSWKCLKFDSSKSFVTNFAPCACALMIWHYLFIYVPTKSVISILFIILFIVTFDSCSYVALSQDYFL